jgi:ferric-dicitrate binding protein FerR (iron transport regulator)
MNEELSQIFGECTEAIEQGRLTIDDCLDKYPQYRAELIDLLQVAMQTRAVPIAVPAAEFRTEARARLLAQLPPRAASNGSVAPAHLAATTAVAQQVQTIWHEFIKRWPWPEKPSLAIGIALLLVLFLFIGTRLGQSGKEAVLVQDNPSAQAEVAASGEEIEDSETEISLASDAAAEDGQEAVAAAATANGANTTFIPLVSHPLNLTPQTAAVEGVQGLVEMQAEDGTWTAVNGATTLAVGQRLRTAELSQATLTFHDGSQAYLDANTEISMDELNALRPEEGFRTVVMTQWMGESEHSVQFRNDGGSRYEVKTPAGSGIARGTKFRVLVTDDDLARYIVTEGKVDVTGQSRTVSVTAGQLTSLLLGNVPDEPLFTVYGEGEVTAIGTTWTIAGQTFQTHAHTIIIGNPQVGDLVHVDGHLLADGSRAADRIVLLQTAVTNRFSLSGTVETIGDSWTVAGQTVVVNGETAVDEGIAVGDEVQVDGIILAGGTLQAQTISRLEAAPGLPFQFNGIVQAISDGSWMISGQVVVVNGETAVDDGIVVGDVVAVRGWILEDGSWLATTIHRQDDELPTFAFAGTVQSIDPWRVSGIGFDIRPWTVIGPNINVGDRVQVRGSILSDGTWVAATITLLADAPANTITFIGIVGSMNPWIVNGLPLVITDDTVIPGSITVGSFVRVQARLQPDGTWTVLRLLPLNPNFGFGCLTLSSPVIAVNADTIQVRHWQGNINRGSIQGDVAVNHIVTLPICTGWDGNIVIIGNVIVIYQPIVVIIDDGGWTPPGGIPPGCKITGIGNNNPHLKCSGGSNKGSGGSKKS